MTDDITRKNGKIHKEVSFSLPDREHDEDPITKNQLRYIKKLAPGIEIDGGLENLGKWQASAVIDYIKEQQEVLEDDIAEGKYDKRGCGCMSTLAIFILSISLIGTFLLI